MYPVKHGIKKTLFMMNIYTFLMVASVNSLYFFKYAGMSFFLGSNLLNAYFIYKLFKLNKSQNIKKDSIKLFGYSIVYLFLIFALTVIDKYLF